MNMNKEDIFKEAKKRGWSYDPLTGVVYTGSGKKANGFNTQYRKKTGETYTYIKCCISIGNVYRNFMSHQFAYWYMTGIIPEQIDHIQHMEDPYKMNRFNNLRESNNQRNQFNRPDVKGYYKVGSKFRSKIFLDGKHIHLGYFTTEEGARNAYLEAKKIYHKI